MFRKMCAEKARVGRLSAQLADKSGSPPPILAFNLSVPLQTDPDRPISSFQERGIRSGTVPAPLVIGLGAACQVAGQEMEYDKAHITRLARRLYHGITSKMDEVVLNGPGDLEGADRYIGNLNMSFAYVEGESLIMGLKVGFRV